MSNWNVAVGSGSWADRVSVLVVGLKLRSADSELRRMVTPQASKAVMVCFCMVL